MNIAVTGANGFIGSWLLKELIEEEKHTVYALVRRGCNRKTLPISKRLSIVETDYTDLNKVEEILRGKDVIIHLIGQMGEYGVTEEAFYQVNVELARVLLEISDRVGIKQFIFCSTPGVQGFGHRLAKEEEPYAPRNEYERTKVLAEQQIITFCKNSNISYTIIRPDFVYGPGDIRRVKMYRNIQKNKFVLTTNGKSFLHPTYITDVTQGFIKSVGNIQANNQIFNISAAKDVTVLEFLKTIADNVHSNLIHINIGYILSYLLAGVIEMMCEKWMSKEAFVSKNKIDFLALNHSTSNTKARQLLGYESQISLQEGMKRTIQWCKDNKLLDQEKDVL